MAVKKFLDRSRIFYSELMRDSINFAKRIHDQTDSVFGTSSPWGQLLVVINRIAQFNFFYIEDSITEQNIETASRPTSIRNWSAISGHSPTRAISARGTIKLVQKSVVQVGSGTIKIPNYTELECSNGLRYMIYVLQDYLSVNTQKNFNELEIGIIQGAIQSSEFTGSGEQMQTYIVQAPTNKFIEEFFHIIAVNDQRWEKKEAFMDMPLLSYTYLVKPNVTGEGITFVFGNNYFGQVPELGSSIKAQYLVSDGRLGNISMSEDASFSFLSSGEDEQGNDVNLNDLFDITYESPIGFGSDPEPIKVTRYLAPKASRSFVLATPENYKTYLEKLRYFSIVDVFQAAPKINSLGNSIPNNTLNIYLVVDPNYRKSLAETYFDIPQTAFYLSEFEEEKIQESIEESGQKLIGINTNFVQPIIKRYVVSMNVTIWKNIDTELVRDKITAAFSEYLLNKTRRVKIPKSDLYAILESIDEIDSSSLYFISEDIERELGLLLGSETFVNSKVISADQFPSNFKSYTTARKLEFIMSMTSFSDFFYKYMDKFGDIVIADNEIALIRGSFRGKDGVFYQDFIDPIEPCILNINFNESDKTFTQSQIG